MPKSPSFSSFNAVEKVKVGTTFSTWMTMRCGLVEIYRAGFGVYAIRIMAWKERLEVERIGVLLLHRRWVAFMLPYSGSIGFSEKQRSILSTSL